MMCKTAYNETKIRPKTILVAIGHGAIKAQNRIIDCGMQGLDFIAISSDAIGLKSSKAATQILLGENRSLGLGMLSMPASRELAEEARDNIKRKLDGSDIVFVVTCMGGSTGSGVAPVVADCARKIGAHTIAVITMPFSFEGVKRRKRAETGMHELKEIVDAIITISNDNLLDYMDKPLSMVTAFNVSDDTIHRCVQQISDLLSIPGLADMNFKDLKPPQLNSEGNCNKDEHIPGGIQWAGRYKTDTNQERSKDFISRLNGETFGCPKSNVNERMKHKENLLPRADGREVCAYLRNLRNDLAKANNIPFESEPCDFEGDCAGTCEKCDREATFLRDELSKIPEQERKYPQHILKDWKKALCTEK